MSETKFDCTLCHKPLEFSGTYAAPGSGQCWKCPFCGASHKRYSTGVVYQGCGPLDMAGYPIRVCYEVWVNKWPGKPADDTKTEERTLVNAYWNATDAWNVAIGINRTNENADAVVIMANGMQSGRPDPGADLETVERGDVK